MPHSPSVSMMNELQIVPNGQQRVNALPPRKMRPPPRPLIRPIDECAVSSLPPRPLLKPAKNIHNGRLRVPYTRSRTDNLDDRRSMSHESSYVSRSPSPACSQSTYRSSSSLSNYDSWQSSDSNRSRSTPRRQFPQSYTDHKIDVHEYYKMEQSPVVYDANLSFVLGVKQPLRQSLRASPAHSEKSTGSSYLSTQIANFLKRTDHVMEEWAAMGRKKDDTVSYIERQREERANGNIGRSKSAANILVRGFQLISSQPSLRRSCSRDIPEIPMDHTDDDQTVCDEEVKLGWNSFCVFCWKMRSHSTRLSSTLSEAWTHFLFIDKCRKYEKYENWFSPEKNELPQWELISEFKWPQNENFTTRSRRCVSLFLCQ